MTKSQTIKFFTDLGISKEIATKLAANIPDSAPETPADEIESAIESVSSHQAELFKNSDDYKTAIKSVKDKALAEVHSKAEKKIIQISGLSAEEVKDKKFDEIAELAWKKAAKTGDSTAEQIQAELNKKDAELQRLLNEEIPKLKEQASHEITAFKMENSLTKQISALKLRKGLSSDDMIILAKTKAEKLGYKMTIDESGDLSFTNQDGTKIMTDDKKQFMKPGEILSKMLDGMIEKSNADDEGGAGSGKGKGIIIETGAGKGDKKDKAYGGEAISSAVLKAQQHAENLKNAASQ